MFRNVFVLLFMLLFSRSAWSITPDEVSEVLGRAEALYYEADFTKSIQLLSPVDELLRSQPEMVREKIGVKLQLALAYVGLNDNANASLCFRQVYELDPEYSMDRQRFSPKVVALADDAMKEQSEVRCRVARENAQTQLEARNVVA